jgi:hypothetical protein
MPERNQEDEHHHGDGAEDPHGEPVAQTIRETSQKDACAFSIFVQLDFIGLFCPAVQIQPRMIHATST